MSIRRLTSGLPGLDLALGGGVPAIARLTELEASATILVRGGAGAGKTLLALHLAAALAEAELADVAYACLELLPTELAAQIDSVYRTDGDSGIQRLARAQRIRVPPFAVRDGEPPHLYAAVLAADPERELDTLGPRLDDLLTGIARAGGRPKVLVLDSIAKGSQLAAPTREFAEALVRLANERGMFLLLLEEGTEGASFWAYAVDLVLELDHLDRSSAGSAQQERKLWVSKNRFGPAIYGPHRLSIQSGLEVWAAPAAYASAWGRGTIGKTWPAPRRGEGLGWNLPAIERDLSLLPTPPRFWGRSVVVYGPDADLVRAVAFRVGADADPNLDYWLELGLTSGWSEALGGWSSREALLTGPELVHRAVADLDRWSAAGNVWRRVLIGDLAALASFYGSDDLERALLALLSVLQARRQSVVLFETTPTVAAPSRPRTFAYWTDTSVEVAAGDDAGHSVRLYDRASGYSISWEPVSRHELLELRLGAGR